MNHVTYIIETGVVMATIFLLQEPFPLLDSHTRFRAFEGHYFSPTLQTIVCEYLRYYESYTADVSN